MTVDTACSSALVALDLACNGLWSGASNMVTFVINSRLESSELTVAGDCWRSQPDLLPRTKYCPIKYEFSLTRWAMS